MYRIGRRLYTRARLDPPNDPASNGEYWLLEKVINRAGEGAVLMDVGSNYGDWTAKALEYAGPRNMAVKAFEPSAFTRNALADRFADDARVEVFASALSSEPGSATLFVSSQGAGSNSLDASSGEILEQVAVETVDRILAEIGIDQVPFLKVDAEGFDPLVMEGALDSLRAGKIDLVQFEYNARWLVNGKSLRDIFKMIDGLPYRLGKLAGEQILLFDKWHFEMDRFFEGNYVLIRRDGPFSDLGTQARFDGCNVLRVD